VFTTIPGSTKSVTIRGGGQKPSSVDLQIQTNFSVTNNGCIVASSTSTVTATPGTILQFDCQRGTGPAPSAGTWNGVALNPDPATHTIVCPAATGDVGKLVLDNKANGGTDTDRMTVRVQ
jgi:hypothetical protein